ncbi:MAG: VanZ family protein [Candidatus Omnitrophica bacterium]|nr:VanZ family protein [Candidatus Omnitrophota bacterium]
MVKGMTRFLKFWGPVFVYMALMWYISSRPVGKIAFLRIPFADKALHIAEFALFGYLLARALSYDRMDEDRILIPIIVIMLGVIWGVIDEIHQLFIPLRNSSIFDVIADAFGASIGGVILIARMGLQGRRRDAENS